MITLTNEEAQKVLGALEDFCEHGAILKPIEVRDLLRAKMHEYPKNQVRPHEFLKAVEGKEEFVGMPIIWAEWPTKEEA
jgi:hypothetical protein